MQIFVIHGGDSFASYEEYITHLKNWQIDLDRLRGGRDWKGTLSDTLGEVYDVFTPSMPNARNAKYLEWKIWFEKFIPFMEDNIVLVGHSLGGLFLAKYLSENNFPKRIRATFLVAPPFGENDFVTPTSFEKLAAQGGDIFLYQSKDDPLVKFEDFEKYQKALPNAHMNVFENRGHFNDEQFPDLVAKIREVGKSDFPRQ